jgi:hypothetical protein
MPRVPSMMAFLSWRDFGAVCAGLDTAMPDREASVAEWRKERRLVMTDMG